VDREIHGFAGEEVCVEEKVDAAIFLSIRFFSVFFHGLVGFGKLYLSGQSHTPRGQKIRVVGQLGCQHAIFDSLDEADQVVDLLVKREIFVVVGLVGVDGCVFVGGADGVGHFQLYMSLNKDRAEIKLSILWLL